MGISGTVIQDSGYPAGNCVGQATREVTSSGAITVSATTDCNISVNKTSGAATTVNLPSSPVTGLTFTISDGKGDAQSHQISITPAAGNISGQSSLILASNWASATIYYSGTQWLQK